MRALCVVTPPQGTPFLVSGGNDAQLLVHSVNAFERQHPVRVCRAPQAPSLAVQRLDADAQGSGSAPLMLSRARNTLDVWRAPPLLLPTGSVRFSQLPTGVYQ